MESEVNPDPSRFAYRTWLASTWTDDGNVIFALGDNEFHGQKVAGACPFHSYLQCWYNAVVALRSNDGGRSFHKLPMKPIGAADFTHRSHPGVPRGFFGPSNIIKQGTQFYVSIYTTGGGDQPSGTCLFRTSDLTHAAAWRYWTGDGFEPSAYDPYSDKGGRKPCKPLSVPGRISSIVRAGDTYIAIYSAQGADQTVGRIGYMTSKDLLNWKPGGILLSVQMLWSKSCGGDRYAYPSVVDLTASDRNFQDIRKKPYLYVMRGRMKGCYLTIDRDLVRYSLVLQ
ncbi:MAG: hypothetical protein NTAFB05_25540 [Nitrobacter sp.]|uniref:hypothetical protein n=1 Tax=Nitrobacter sp. TaxID=29420 RepID=UPI00387DEA77